MAPANRVSVRVICRCGETLSWRVRIHRNVPTPSGAGWRRVRRSESA